MKGQADRNRTPQNLLRAIHEGKWLSSGKYPLSEEQFAEIVREFQEEAVRTESRKQFKLYRLCMNLMSLAVKGKRAGKRAIMTGVIRGF